MKTIAHFVAALAAATALAQQAHATLAITEVMSNSGHPGGTSNADWFELTNTGTVAFDITGWTWDDDTTTTPGNFGSLTSIPAGASVVFTGETVGAESDFKTDWGIPSATVVNLGGTVFQAFGSTGDQLRIFNASSTLVLSITIPAATTGFTFEYDTAGTSLGLSVIGENLAFQAAEDGATGSGIDVGSPGLAVPEPSAALAFLSGSALLALRRRRH